MRSAPDRNLAVLGRELEKAIAEYLPKWQHMRSVQAEWERQCREGGLSCDEGGAGLALRDEMGVDEAGEALDPLCDRIEALCEEITQIPPIGPIGVAAWANVLAWNQGNFTAWTAPPDEVDPDKLTTIAFVSHMRRLAGQSPFAEPLS